MTDFLGFKHSKKSLEEKIDEARSHDYFDFMNESRSYCFLPGSWMSFAFTDSSEAYEVVRENLRFGGSLKKRLASIILPLVRYTPFSVKLPYDSSNNFPGEVLIDSRRLKSFDLQSKKVHSLGSHSEQFIDVRKSLNDLDINAPELLYSDSKLVVEEYIPTKQFEVFDEDREEPVLEAFKQLFIFYRYQDIEQVEVSDLLDKDILLVQKALDRTDRSYLVTGIHGDFHIGHIGVTEDKTVIYDWQDAGGKGFLMDDFHNMLVQQYKYTGDKSYFKQLKTSDRSPELEKITELFKEEFELSEKEVFDYYLLFLARKISEGKQGVYRELLQDALSQ